jgi:hypothetical protein
MNSLTQSILAHVNEVCHTVLPVMNTSTEMTTTSTLQLGEYTVTVTLSKTATPSILGKRKGEEHATERVMRPFPQTHARLDPSDAILYNNWGHNFYVAEPNAPVTCGNLSYIQ